MSVTLAGIYDQLNVIFPDYCNQQKAIKSHVWKVENHNGTLIFFCPHCNIDGKLKMEVSK